MERESIWEIREKAPHHYHSRACNALLCARLLADLIEGSAIEDLSKLNVSIPNQIALSESFQREAALAIELILKSVICAERKQKPTFGHDVYKLWNVAGLPRLADADNWRLTLLSEILYWSGRYPSPTKEKDLVKEKERFEKYQLTEKVGNLTLVKSEKLGFAEIQALFKIADQKFWALVS